MAQVLPSGAAAVSQGGTSVPRPVWVSVQPGVPLGLVHGEGPTAQGVGWRTEFSGRVAVGDRPPGEPWFTDSLSQETSPQRALGTGTRDSKRRLLGAPVTS